MGNMRILTKLIGKNFITSGAGLKRYLEKQKAAILPPK